MPEKGKFLFDARDVERARRQSQNPQLLCPLTRLHHQAARTSVTTKELPSFDGSREISRRALKPYFGKLSSLTVAYLLEGRPRYLKAVEVILRKLLEIAKQSGGRLSVEGIQEWGIGTEIIAALDHLNQLPGELAQEVKSMMRLFACHHFQDIVNYQTAGKGSSNHAVTNACAAANILSFWPALSMAAHWRRLAIEAVNNYPVAGFLPGGAQIERSPSYHQVCLRAMVYFLAGTGALLEDGYDEEETVGNSLRRGLDYLIDLMTPGGTAPAFNDGHDRIDASLFFWAAQEWGEPRYQWAGWRAVENGCLLSPFGYMWLDLGIADTGGPKGSVCCRDAGVAVLRGEAGGKAAYLAIKCDDFLGWHGHPDRGTFELWLGRTPLTRDPGSVDYQLAEHWSWYRRLFSHNCIAIVSPHKEDLQAQDYVYKDLEFAYRRAEVLPGRILDFEDGDSDALVSCEFTNYPGVPQKRTFRWDKTRNWFLVSDRVSSPEEEQFEWLFHGEGTVSLDASRRSFLYQQGGVNLLGLVLAPEQCQLLSSPNPVQAGREYVRVRAPGKELTYRVALAPYEGTAPSLEQIRKRWQEEGN
jgi:hypothetical protein